MAAFQALREVAFSVLFKYYLSTINELPPLFVHPLILAFNRRVPVR